jgi:hypothetical protein
VQGSLGPYGALLSFLTVRGHDRRTMTAAVAVLYNPAIGQFWDGGFQAVIGGGAAGGVAASGAPIWYRLT